MIRKSKKIANHFNTSGSAIDYLIAKQHEFEAKTIKKIDTFSITRWGGIYFVLESLEQVKESIDQYFRFSRCPLKRKNLRLSAHQWDIISDIQIVIKETVDLIYQLEGNTCCISTVYFRISELK